MTYIGSHAFLGDKGGQQTSVTRILDFYGYLKQVRVAQRRQLYVTLKMNIQLINDLTKTTRFFKLLYLRFRYFKIQFVLIITVKDALTI